MTASKKKNLGDSDCRRLFCDFLCFVCCVVALVGPMTIHLGDSDHFEENHTLCSCGRPNQNEKNRVNLFAAFLCHVDCVVLLSMTILFLRISSEFR